MEITSRENATFKELLKLTAKKWRRQLGLCIIEGEKIVSENQAAAVQVYRRGVNLSEKLFDLVTNLENGSGVLAVVPIPKPKGEITFPYLIFDGIQDPGNVGALLRSALAFGFNTIVCINCVDVWSQKVLRASSGVQFNLNIIEASGQDFIKPENSCLIAADLQGECFDTFHSNNPRFGLVLGSEGRGISQAIKSFIDRTVTIPINYCVESLNVAVAGGILMYKLGRNA